MLRSPRRCLAGSVTVAAAMLLTACASRSIQTADLVTISASSSVYPWLENAYDCRAASGVIALSAGVDADVILRLGEPRELTQPAFQVGTDDLIVIAHRQSGVNRLTAAEAEALFAGQVTNWKEVGGADQAVQVWAFATGLDIQDYFERTILRERPVSSKARLAVSAQHMSDSVGATPGSIGILPRRWKAGNTIEVMLVASLPVLAITREAPPTSVSDLIACMQMGR